MGMKRILVMMAAVMLMGCEEGYISPLERGERLKAKAEGGDARSQSSLGFNYRIGWVEEGFEQDYVEAVKWYRKAAMQGDASGQHGLGEMYSRGKGGLQQNFRRAFEWYLLSANQGYSLSQWELSTIYEFGIGDKELDFVTSYAWLKLANINEASSSLKPDMTRIKSKMTSTQITKAEELVKEMVKKNPKLLNK